MSKHKSEDYKISAVNYYLDNDVSMDYVCNIFNCKKQSLSRWVQRYNNDKSIKRYNRKPISYKITKQQVEYTLKYTIVIFGWELAENILCPHLFPDLYYFKETPENIAGDILLALPGYYLLTHKNILNKIDITIHRFLKFDVS